MQPHLLMAITGYRTVVANVHLRVNIAGIII
jgi:hypothetical protein